MSWRTTLKNIKESFAMCLSGGEGGFAGVNEVDETPKRWEFKAGQGNVACILHKGESSQSA